ncbi:MAG: methyltransferase domain-containing protein [Anaerolineae bacterium]
MTYEPGYWDQVAEEWRDHRLGLWRAHMDAVYSHWVAPRLPSEKASRVLKTDLFDEALGDGLMPLLSSRARLALGVDVAGAIIAAARARQHSLRGVAADVRALPFAVDTFDVIISGSTLDHFATLAEVKTSLVELARVLRPGGELLLTLDNLANPLLALRAALPLGLLRRVGLVPYFVGATCGPARLRYMVEHTGLQVEEITALLHGPRVLGVSLARRLEDRRDGRAAHLYRWCLWACERLERWPTRYLTGHYIALRAVKPDAAGEAG